jgi:hypothetical protein
MTCTRRPAAAGEIGGRLIGSSRTIAPYPEARRVG